MGPVSMKKTLYLISCSDHKQSGGEPYRADLGTVSLLLSSDIRRRLQNVRRQVFQLIAGNHLLDQEKRQGYRGRDPRNAHLVLGPDFEGNSFEGRYLPACLRYTGRFFGQIQDCYRERTFDLGVWENANTQVDMTLILSGLYGLLLPTEPIQEYTCHLADRIVGGKQGLLQLWKPVLTAAILEIIGTGKIERIVDLLSEQVYQEAVDWAEIYKTRTTCFHRCFKLHAGPETLVNLGRFYQIECLASGERHFNFDHDIFIGRKYFDPPEERILFETRINATRKRVVREGLGEVEPELRNRLTAAWQFLDEQTRHLLANSEYAYIRNLGLAGFDFAAASVTLTKAIEHWVMSTIVERLLQLRDLSDVYGQMLNEKGGSTTYNPALGDMEKFLRRCGSAQLFSFVSRQFSILSRGSVFELCDDICQVRRSYRNDWIHSRLMPASVFEEYREFARSFFNKWVPLFNAVRT